VRHDADTAGQGQPNLAGHCCEPEISVSAKGSSNSNVGSTERLTADGTASATDAGDMMQTSLSDECSAAAKT
jgi:hypothetical protein